jgi:hypothetical protein
MIGGGKDKSPYYRKYKDLVKDSKIVNKNIINKPISSTDNNNTKPTDNLVTLS